MISRNEISIDEVLARTKVQLLIANTTEHDDYLEMMISEGLRHLDAITLCKKKQCILDIVDSKAELPKGFQKLLGMRILKTVLMNQQVNGIMQQVPIPICSPIFYVDTIFLNNCECDNLNGNNILQNFRDTMQISGNTIHFNSNNIESGQVSLAFMVLNVDEFGRILIYEEYERALSSYASYMFSLAYLQDNRSVAMADRYYAIWVAQKAWIKAGAWKDEFQKTKMEIASMVSALVSDQTVNWL